MKLLVYKRTVKKTDKFIVDMVRPWEAVEIKPSDDGGQTEVTKT